MLKHLLFVFLICNAGCSNSSNSNASTDTTGINSNSSNSLHPDTSGKGSNFPANDNNQNLSKDSSVRHASGNNGSNTTNGSNGNSGSRPTSGRGR